MASVTIIFGGQEQKTFTLLPTRMVVGRDPVCEIPIDNLGISRQHCAFSARGEAFIVQDLNSSNGTYVNGRKITEHFLNDADEVMIGKYTLKFKNEAQAAAAPASEAGASSPVPDTLNTYVMDGAKIKEQLDKMRAETAPAGAGSAAKSPSPGTGATAKDYAKALDPASGGEGAGSADSAKMKTILIAAFAVIFVLLAVIGLLFAGVIKP